MCISIHHANQSKFNANVQQTVDIQGFLVHVDDKK